MLRRMVCRRCGEENAKQIQIEKTTRMIMRLEAKESVSTSEAQHGLLNDWILYVKTVERYDCRSEFYWEQRRM